jgi:hydroxymethylpyrimidine pyrophosphatase-like HAD family hydrolase
MPLRRRLVALDLDGTLLSDDFDPSLVGRSPHVTAANIAVLQQLSAQGVHVALATGRVASSAALVAEVLGLDCPMVTNNGAVVLSSFRDGERSTAAGSIDGRQRVVLHRSFFPESLVLAAIRLSEQLRVPVLLHHPDTHAESGQGISCCGDPESCHPEHVHEYVNADEWPWATAPSDLSAAQAALVLSSTNRMHVHSCHDKLVDSAPTSRIWKVQLFVTVVSATAEEVAHCLEALPELHGCTVLRQAHFVELVPPSTNKATVSSELRHACSAHFLRLEWL